MKTAGGDDARVDCAVVVVTYNSAGNIERFLGSLPAAADGLRLRVVVVDNGSSDRTVELVKGTPGILCVESGANLGYAGAVNIGRAWARPFSSLLVANPDVWFELGAIARLYTALKDPGVGVTVPMLVDGTGKLYRSIRREPSFSRAMGDALWGSRFGRRPGWLAETVYSAADYEQRHSVEWATGAVLLVSEACDAAVGPWDDHRFFLYSEETDFFRRARQAGYRVEYVPSARASHDGGGSGYSPALAALMAVNRVRYFEKWHRRPAASLFRAAVALNELVRSFDRTHRNALRHVVRRATWATLPGATTEDGRRGGVS